MKRLASNSDHTLQNTETAPSPEAGDVVSVLGEASAQQQSGKQLLALKSFLSVRDAVENLTDPTSTDEQAWLQSTTGVIETAARIQQAPFATEVLQASVKRFHNTNWTQSKQATSSVYRKLICIAGKAGHPEDALKIFDSARKHVVLDQTLRRTLVDASVSLNRSENLGTAYLCLEELTEGVDRSPEEIQQIIDLVRQTLRIDLEVPSDSQLAENVKLLLRMKSLGDFPWADAYLGIAAFREHQHLAAFRAIKDFKREADSDAESLGLAALIQYAVGNYKSAYQLLNDLQEDPENSTQFQQREFLKKLCRLVLLLDGQTKCDRQADLQTFVLSEMQQIKQSVTGTVWDLDAQLVLVCACVSLNDFEQVKLHWRPSLELSPKPWMVPLYSEALAFCGEASDKSSREKNHLLPVEHAAQVAVLTRAQILVGQTPTLDWSRISDDAEEDVLNGDQVVWLRDVTGREVDRLNPVFSNVELQHGAPPGSNQLRAWQSRLSRWDRIRNGTSAEVRHHASSTAPLLCPPREVERLEIMELIEQADQTGWTPEQTEIIHQRFAKQSQQLEQFPLDRLALFLWHVEQNQFAQAESEVTQLPLGMQNSIEVLLGRSTILLKNQQPDAARKILGDFTNRGVWENTPILTHFRPWRTVVPLPFRKVSGDISPLRICDLLQTVDQQIEIRMLPEARMNLRMAVDLLGASQHAIRPVIGERFSKLALLELPTDVVSACELHRSALACGHEDSRFCEELSRTISKIDEVPEIVFAVLLQDIVKANETRRTGIVGERVVELTFINHSTPSDPLLLNQRTQWAERCVTALPDWDPVRRHFSHALFRKGEFIQLLEVSASLQSPDRDDHDLRGRAFWTLKRYSEAATEFAAGQIAGWMGCAAAAARLQQLWAQPVALDAAESKVLLEQLEPDQVSDEFTQQVLVWRGAVLLAGNAFLQAKSCFQSVQKESALNVDALPHIHLLEGLADLLAGNEMAAEQSWIEQQVDSILKHFSWPLAEISKMQRRSWNDFFLSHEKIDEHRKIGLTSPAMHLAEAHRYARLGFPEQVNKHLARSITSRTTQDDALLAPLAIFLHDEERVLSARGAMLQHDFASAIQEFSRVTPARPWQVQVDYWRLLCDLHNGSRNPEELAVFAKGDSIIAPHAAAQLAFFLLGSGDTSQAQLWIKRSLHLEQDHPFAMATQGRLYESQNDLTQAKSCYFCLKQRPKETLTHNLRINTLLALGRIALHEAETDQAAGYFDEAYESAPRHPEATKRRALLSALQANDRNSIAQAEAAVREAQQLNPNDADLSLALVSLARNDDLMDAMAARFNEMIELDSFSLFRPQVRRRLSLHGAEIQRQQRDFGSAANALSRLYEEDPTVDIREQLLHCRLLEALQKIRSPHLADDALEQVFQASTAICDAGSPPPVAVLLWSISGSLMNGLTETEQAHAAQKLADLGPSLSRELKSLQFLAGHLLGVAEFSTKFEATFKDEPGTRRAMNLLLANRAQNGEVLRDEVERILRSSLEEANVFPPDELLLAVIASLGIKNIEECCDLVQRWHSRQQGTPMTRAISSVVLTKRAAFLLKKKEFRAAMSLMDQAVALVNGDGAAQPEIGLKPELKDFLEGSF